MKACSHCGSSVDCSPVDSLCARCYYNIPEHMRWPLTAPTPNARSVAIRQAVNYLRMHFASINAVRVKRRG